MLCFFLLMLFHKGSINTFRFGGVSFKSSRLRAWGRPIIPLMSPLFLLLKPLEHSVGFVNAFIYTNI